MAARDNRYFGALVLVAAIIPLPFLAALITIIAYLSPSPLPAVAFFNWLGPSNMVIILGLIITLVLWLLLAIPCMDFATAAGARPSDYNGLQGAYKVLWNEFEQVRKCDDIEDIALVDIRSNLEGIDKVLIKGRGMTWLSTGYVSLWDRINKADEAIIGVLPWETVIESAKYEELRLKNYLVPDSENLLNLLGEAIKTLSSDPNRSKQPSEQNQDTNLQHSLAQAMLALLKSGIDSPTRSASTGEPLYKRIWRSIRRIYQPHSHQQDKANKLQQSLAQAMLALLKKAADPPSPSAANNGQVSQQSKQEARANIRKVKSALHKFTNERWDGLVRTRNQLMVTAFLTAFFTYILVVIAILANVPSMNTLDAMVFYFLGAIVGLFGRLFDERNADTVLDDYGLSMARIIVTPLISGLAALVGVLFVTTSSTIGTIYKISLQNLVFAAVLGFAPNILISMLRSKSEDIKSQIKSANPSHQKSGTSRSGSSKGNSSGDSGY
jgi:hypothetical protein